MSQTSYRYIVGEIQKMWAYNFPDSTVTSAQITYWVLIAENYIRQRSLKVTMTGSFLTEFSNVSVQTDNIRKWFILPSQVVDLDNEKGIDYVLYQQSGIPYGKQIRFQQTEADIIDKLYWNPYEKPSPSNPYFYRVNQTIYLLGLENVYVPSVQMGLYTALDTRPVLLNIDSVISINEEQIITLREMVFQFARLGIIVPKGSLDETGTDNRSNENVNAFAKADKPQQ